MKLKLAEPPFETLQGEGQYCGVPSLFIRVSGCPLRCHWCDTKFSSWAPEGDQVNVADLCDTVAQSRSRHVVITGGEPLLYPQQVGELIQAARLCGKPVTIETSGAIEPGTLNPNLWSVSPKLSSAAPGPEHPKERALHLRNHAKTQDAMRVFALKQERCQFKFVVTDEADVNEVRGQFVKRFHLSPERVWLMPEGVTTEKVMENARFAAEVCKQEGWNLTLRMHVLLWGHRRGV